RGERRPAALDDETPADAVVIDLDSYVFRSDRFGGLLAALVRLRRPFPRQFLRAPGRARCRPSLMLFVVKARRSPADMKRRHVGAVAGHVDADFGVFLMPFGVKLAGLRAGPKRVGPNAGRVLRGPAAQ